MIKAAAFILIGGKSLRFGSSKWEVKIGQETVLERILDSCKEFESIKLVGKDRPLRSQAPFIKDGYELHAPMVGLHAALKQSQHDWNLIISCDLPLITARIIDQLWKNNKKGSDVIIPVVNDMLQTTCAFYHRKLLDLCTAGIQNNMLCLNDLVRSVNYLEVGFSDQIDAFLNMNTKEDLAWIKKTIIIKRMDQS